MSNNKEIHSSSKLDKQGGYQAKFPDENNVIAWTATENNTWKTLIERQLTIIENRACDKFIQGLSELALPTDRVPQLTELNEKLQKTGWSMQAVAGTVLVKDFLTLLSQRIFPVANFIRVPDSLNYVPQPDVFHEVFGHGPLLLCPEYADFVQWYGEMALSFNQQQRQLLSRVYWYTVEFGLIESPKGKRILGAGILSSYEETLSCLGEDPNHQPQYIPFCIANTMKMPYDYQKIQETYFLLNNLDQLWALQTTPHLKDQLVSPNNPEDGLINC